jgi:UDP-N-acetyl-D-galactosamine dehydrogenase
MNASNEKLVIMGLGYVGLPLALQAHKKGKIVLGYDTDAARISSLQTSKNSQIEFSANAENLASASVIIICVPTPVDEHHNPDLGPVKNAAETIGKHLQEDQLVILESTVNPGVTENVVVPILEAQSGLKAGADFYVAHCPERINPGDSRCVLFIHHRRGSAANEIPERGRSGQDCREFISGHQHRIR